MKWQETGEQQLLIDIPLQAMPIPLRLTPLKLQLEHQGDLEELRPLYYDLQQQILRHTDLEQRLLEQI